MKRVPLTECWSFSGATPKKFEGEKRYISTGALDRDHVNESDVEMVTYENRPSRANLEVSEGDILFAKMASTEKTFMVDSVAANDIYSTGFCAVKAKESKILPKCLYYFLSSSLFLEQKDKNSSGATQKAITNSGLSKIYINLPDLSEQQEFITQMNSLCSLITARREQLAKLDELIKSRFIEMFGASGEERFPMKTLSQIIAKDKYSLKRGPFGGALKKEDFVNKGYLVYEQRHAIHNDFEYEKYYITPQKYEDMIMFKVAPGDLIISCSGVTLGRIAEIPSHAKEGIINQALLKVSLDQKIMTNTFFIHQFRSDRIQDILFGFCRGSGIPNFPSMSEVKAVQFICPPIELQTQFADFVEQIDKSKFEIQKSLEKLEILKKALMQQYFG